MNGSMFSLQSQRGVSLSGLIGVLAIIAVVAIFAMKVLPTYTEYLSAKDAINAAGAAGESPNEARGAFAAAANVNSITSLKSSDLVIEKIDGKNVISFDYEKDIPLFKNVRLVIRYAATTAADGVVPERVEDDPKTK